MSFISCFVSDHYTIILPQAKAKAYAQLLGDLFFNSWGSISFMKSGVAN